MTHKLHVTTPSDTTILIERTFDATRDLLYEAFSKPELIMRWMGPRASPVIEATIDLRVGGKWRYVSALRKGGTMGFGGVFKEIVPNERLVTTEIFDAWPDTESTVVTTFVEKDGKTTVSLLCTYPSKDVRDQVLASGMQDGVAEGYERLDEILRG